MKKFFGKIVSFLQMLFTNLDAWIHEHVKPAIETVQQIKSFVDNKALDVLTQFIPGELDNAALKWLRTNLTKAIDTLAITAKITDEPDFTQKIVLLINYLRTLSPDLRNAVYLKLSSLIAQSSGKKDKVKGHSVDLLTQLQYSKLAEGVNAEDLAESKYTATAVQDKQIYNAVTGKFESIGA